MSNVIDVAIVGGGVSGVYAGWRLVRDAPGMTAVHLFEMSDRVGGRLLSVTPPEMPGFEAELGGMRYLTNQPLVQNLVTQLGLETVPFPVSGPDNIYYVRGRHLRGRDFADPDKVPYRLSWLERGKSPGELITQAIDAIVPGCLNLSEAQWLEVKKHYKFHGNHLYDLGFWNVLHEVMSSEAYKLLMDAGGYNTTLTNWNAAEALPWYLADFGPEAKYMSLVDGYEHLPRTLAQQFTAEGGKLHLNRRLTGFHRLTDEDGRPLIELHFDNHEPVRTRHLLLALPRRALELIDPDRETDFFSHAAVRDLIPTVTPHPMFKLFLCYRYPWWLDAGVKVGRSVTDLPLRQIYYFGSEPEGPVGYNPELRDSLVMASYDDGPHVGFWSGMANLPDTAVSQTGTRWDQFDAPQAMIDHAQRQLKLVHDLEYLPEPYAAAFMDWGQDPYGGAWNSWNIHVKAWEVQSQMLQPLDDWPVYVCGEAYSGAQGWVEGALQTAEQVLTEKLGVKRDA